MNSKTSSKVLGTFTLAMITMAAVISLRNLSLTAELGISAVFFLCLAAIIFFIPCALVVAELASAWPKAGGCYVWVGEAFGKSWAFFTLWLSWMASVAWFPTILIFTATMFGHMLSPVLPFLEHSNLFIVVCMLGVFWVTTIFNFWGIECSGWFSSVGVILGTLIPGVLIIFLGLHWVAVGNQTHIPLSIDALTPSFSMDNLIMFAGVILSLAGVELAAYHIVEAKNPQRSYPRALLLASILLLIVYILGTLAIEIVVPAAEISLASGLIQAFAVFFHNIGLPTLIPLMAAFLLLGALAGINAWLIGPAKGMLIVAQDGFLPTWMRKVNQQGVPTTLLILQAVVGSILSLLFMWLKNNNTSIWLLTALTAQFTCIVYILIFAAAIKLRYSKANVIRPFKVNCIWLVAGSGILASIFGFFIVYAPHTKLVSIEYVFYSVLLIVSLLVLCLPPFLLIQYRYRSKSNIK